MKVTIYLTISSLSLCFAQSQEESGQYAPDQTGEYFPTNEGQYIHDDSGKYIPDYSGLYRDDGTGRYTHIEDTYKQYREKFSRDTHGSATQLRPQIVKPVVTTPSPPPTRYGKYDDSRWKIIRLHSNVNKDGFHWEYETENEIEGQENAKVLNKGTKDESITAKGFYKYTGPDNIVYYVEYTADDRGFIPKADHLPISLQKALSLHASNAT